MAGFTGTIHSRCAMYSLRASFWIVPPRRPAGMSRFSAAARYIAQTIEAGPLIVIDVVTLSTGIRSKRISMSRSVSTATPSRPTSPRESGSSEDRKSTRLNSSHRTISYAVFCLLLPPPRSTLFPYTTLFRSRNVALLGRREVHRPDDRGRPVDRHRRRDLIDRDPIEENLHVAQRVDSDTLAPHLAARERVVGRSEEHTSELQSPYDLVCRLLLATPPPEIYTLSLHDALPISECRASRPPRGTSPRRSRPAR